MDTITEVLTRALLCHQSGKLQEAEQLYRQILQSHPTDAKVLALLGVALVAQGQFEEGAEFLRQALAIDPSLGDVWNNRGVALARLGKLDEAAASYQEALRLKPNDVDTLYNLSDALRGQRRLLEAEDSYRRALQLRPDYVKAWNGLGVTLADQGRLDDAMASFQQALHFHPGNAESYNNLAQVLARQNRYDAAVECARQAVRFGSGNVEFYNNLGLLLLKQNQADRFSSNEAKRTREALATFGQALAIQPDSFELRQNLGVALHEADQFEDAIASFRTAVGLRPENAQAHYNLAVSLGDLRRYEEELASCREAVRLQPDYAEAHKVLGLTLLTMGQFEEGWREYEWRLRCPDNTARAVPRPRWDGAELGDKIILLHAEQGLGDTIQFIRYAALVKRRGGSVWVECQKPLVQLLAGCPGIDRLFGQGSAIPPINVQVPLVSLPGILQTSMNSIPADVPYLFAEPKLVEAWRARLSSISEMRVGINWQGNVYFRRSRQRSVPVPQMLRLAQIGGVRLISMQMGAERNQLREYPEHASMFDPGPDFNVTAGPFLDSAALLMNLDVLVTSDTAVAHLAGALGVPVWIALPFNADWRWFCKEDDSPWYPSMRLFRQKQFGDWDEVFD
ncbi:MAG TPA: tetratricopeptide repeat protein, partial [Gemmataceae bacterium]|nr:tetratricopeptide repeat protein [Gemmataceae bacterium]